MILLLPLSDWAETPEIKIRNSWILIIVIQAILVLPNMVLVIGSAFHNVHLLINYYYRRYK